MFPYERKVKYFKPLSEQCAVTKVTTSVQSAVFRPYISFYRSQFTLFNKVSPHEK